jgi:hypothetical protein
MRWTPQFSFSFLYVSLLIAESPERVQVPHAIMRRETSWAHGCVSRGPWTLEPPCGWLTACAAASPSSSGASMARRPRQNQRPGPHFYASSSIHSAHNNCDAIRKVPIVFFFFDSGRGSGSKATSLFSWPPNPKSLRSTRHIESLDACMKY